MHARLRKLDQTLVVVFAEAMKTRGTTIQDLAFSLNIPPRHAETLLVSPIRMPLKILRLVALYLKVVDEFFWAQSNSVEIRDDFSGPEPRP